MAHINNQKLSRVVADRLQERIIRQKLDSGTKLPTEPELMEEFGVSRTVVREAATLLLARGLVDIKPRRGMTVNAPDSRGVADSLNAQLLLSQVTLPQLLQVRLILEVAIVRIAAVERTESDIAGLQENISRLKGAIDDKEATIQLDTSFHELLAAATSNPFFTLVCRPIIELLRDLYMKRAGYMLLVEQTYGEHQNIVDAIIEKDPDAAELAMRNHLERTEQNIGSLMSESTDS